MALPTGPMEFGGPQGAELSPGARRASLAAIIASTFGVGINLGILTPLVALILERDGVDTTLIGLNAAMPALAILLFAARIASLASKLVSCRTQIKNTISAIFVRKGVETPKAKKLWSKTGIQRLRKQAKLLDKVDNEQLCCG